MSDRRPSWPEQIAENVLDMVMPLFMAIYARWMMHVSTEVAWGIFGMAFLHLRAVHIMIRGEANRP